MLITSKLFKCTLFLLIVNCAYSQLNMDVNLLNEINQKVAAKYGQTVKVNFIYQIDSLEISNSKYPAPYQINDTYGTLQNATIFTAIKYDSPCKGLVGVYKNNNIIWDSDTTINCEDVYGDFTGLTVFSIFDLNKDGVIDILFSSSRSGLTSFSNIQRLYIYSFDGINGNLISETNDDNISTLKSFLGVGDFDFVDVDGNGIYEITGLWYLPNEDNAKTVTYYWDGTNYIFDPSKPQPQPYEFLIQRNINTFTKSTVEKDASDFIYNYKIKNLVTGKQEINAVYFRCGVDSAIENFPPTGWISVNLFELFGFEDLHVPTLYENNHFIRIDSTKIFEFKSDGLPSIVTLFIQGYNRTPSLEDTIDGHVITFQDFYNNVISNSYISSTIGPSNLFYSLNEQEILDSMRNYGYQSYLFSWILNQATTDKYDSLFNTAKTQLQQNNNPAAINVLDSVLTDVEADNGMILTSEAYALIKYNTEYLKDQLTQSHGTPHNVRLLNSQGQLLTGGSLQYYDGGWKTAINNGDGTFLVDTERSTVSLRMSYEGGNETRQNVPIQGAVVTFKTVNSKVELHNSQNQLMPAPMGDQGSVQYYAGGWRDFGATSGGVASKELLPIQYSFRMAYAHASIDKQQNIGQDSVVVFQTVAAKVELHNSTGNLMPTPTGDQGMVQYYAGAWREFGTTSGGIVTKELLPKQYSFRMTYAYASIDKQQDVGSDPTVVFQTVNAQAELRDSNGNLMPAPMGDQGTVQYYAGAWREFGTTSGGIASKELLPKQYSFRMTYAYASIDKQQDISTDPVVSFATVLAAINVTRQQNQALNGAQVSYYSGAWRTIGETVNGSIARELLPRNYTFRAAYQGTSANRQQDISQNSTVNIQLNITGP
jgi:hypothetical protein